MNGSTPPCMATEASTCGRASYGKHRTTRHCRRGWRRVQHPKAEFPVGDSANSLGRQSVPVLMHHPTVLALFLALITTLRSALCTRGDRVLENHALRQQLADLRHGGPPCLRASDRAFWILLLRLWRRCTTKRVATTDRKSDGSRGPSPEGSRSPTPIQSAAWLLPESKRGVRLVAGRGLDAVAAISDRGYR